MTSNSLQPPQFFAIIAAAGIGTRMAANVPKQYLKIANKTILEHAASPFLTHPLITKVVIVLHHDDPHWAQLEWSNRGRFHTATGGETRAHSVWQGLKSLGEQANANDWVLVHDGVRPMISEQEITQLIHSLEHDPVGGLFGVAVTETLKIVKHGEIIKTHPREFLWRAQSPQMFRYGILSKALERGLSNNSELTDEASAIEQLGYFPKMITGHPRNIKITTEPDLLLAKCYLEECLI